MPRLTRFAQFLTGLLIVASAPALRAELLLPPLTGTEVFDTAQMLRESPEGAVAKAYADLRDAPTDEVKIQAYLELAMAGVLAGDSKMSIIAIEQGLGMRPAEPVAQRFLLLKAWLHKQQYKPEHGLPLARAVFDWAQARQHGALTFDSLVTEAQLRMDLHQYELAGQRYQQAQQLVEDGRVAATHALYLPIAQALLAQRDSSQAQAYLLKDIEQHSLPMSDSHRGNLHLALAEASWQQEDAVAALTYLQQAESLFEAQTDMLGLARTYLAMADLHWAIGHTDSARYYYAQCQASVPDGAAHQDIAAQAFIGLARTWLKSRQPDAALTALEQARLYSQVEETALFQQLAAQVSMQQGNATLAFMQLEQAHNTLQVEYAARDALRRDAMQQQLVTQAALLNDAQLHATFLQTRLAQDSWYRHGAWWASGALALVGLLPTLWLWRVRRAGQQLAPVDSDALTGLENHQTIMRRLNALVSGKSQKPVIVAVIEMDRLEKFNEACGFNFGDNLIKAFADHARVAFLPQYSFGRISGKKFLLLMNNVSHDDAVAQINQFRSRVAHLPEQLGDSSHPLSISVGFIETHASADLNAILDKASLALNHARSAPRDKVTCRFVA